MSPGEASPAGTGSDPAVHQSGSPGAGTAGPGPAVPGPEDEEALAQLEELRGQLVATPVDVVVANHAYGLFELAAIHLSERPARLDQARLAIDAFGALVEGLAGRLGDAEPSLVDALAQLRLAFVQMQAAHGAEEPGPGH